MAGAEVAQLLLHHLQCSTALLSSGVLRDSDAPSPKCIQLAKDLRKMFTVWIVSYTLISPELGQIKGL